MLEENFKLCISYALKNEYEESQKCYEMIYRQSEILFESLLNLINSKYITFIRID